MTKMEVVKGISQIIVSVGVGCIVGHAVRFTTPSDIGTIKKFCVAAGSGILGSMLSDKASEYTNAKIDEIVTAVKDLTKEPEKEI